MPIFPEGGLALLSVSQAYLAITILITQLRWFCQTPVLCLGLGVDFTFAWDNHNNHNHNHNNPHLNSVEGTVLEDKEQGVGIRDKG